MDEYRYNVLFANSAGEPFGTTVIATDAMAALDNAERREGYDIVIEVVRYQRIGKRRAANLAALDLSPEERISTAETFESDVDAMLVDLGKQLSELTPAQQREAAEALKRINKQS